MQARGALPAAKVLSIAASVGADAAALKTAMNDPAIETILERNYRLAQSLDINGTPAFVIGGKLVPGAIDIATMKKMIADARGS
jgi:protein-disulfide isomerase